MIIFLYGQDDFRREARKRAIIAEFQKRHSALGVGRFNLEEKDEFAQLEEFSRNQSMFDPVKLAVVDGLFEGAPKGAGAFFKSFLDRKEITFLVIEKDKPVKALDFLIKKPALSEQFELLKGLEWKKFATEEANKRGITFAQDAFTFLLSVYEGQSWRLVTELEKLQWLGKKAITKADLESFGLELAPQFFNTLQTLARGGIRERATALETFFAGHEPAAKIFNILAYQSPEATGACAVYDRMMKSGALDYEEALVDFVMR